MKLCTAAGCGKKHRARGLCTTHYNQTYLRNRYAEDVTVVCAGCGRSCEKRPDPRRPRRYCSLKCRTDDQYRELRASRPGTALVHVGPAWPRSELPARHPARRPPARRPGCYWSMFIAGGCAWCSTYFVAPAGSLETASRYCSRKCQRRAGRARRGRFDIAPVARLAIYERDGWICQLCFGPVDPDLSVSDQWSATLDHIVCQSWSSDPDHSPENLRLAHRWCNSVRGAEQYYTAADLAA